MKIDTQIKNSNVEAESRIMNSEVSMPALAQGQQSSATSPYQISSSILVSISPEGHALSQLSMQDENSLNRDYLKNSLEMVDAHKEAIDGGAESVKKNKLKKHETLLTLLTRWENERVVQKNEGPGVKRAEETLKALDKLQNL